MTAAKKIAVTALAFCALGAVRTVPIVSAQDHSTSIAWSAPAQPSGETVANWRVYRQGPGDAAMQLIANVIASGFGYTDATVADGSLYQYAMTSVDTLNNESAFTPSVSFAIPGTPVTPPPPPPPTTGVSLLASARPAKLSGNDGNAVGLGMKFSSSVAGTITAIKFYKAINSTGTHTGHIWSSSGGALFAGTFSGETASGWQTLQLATPLAIAANTTYTVSYHTSEYVWSQPYGWPVSSAPLAAPANAGVYAYGSGSAFPTSTYQSSNYFVDVVFVPTGTP